MKKKLSLLLCLVFMALGLTACGTDPQDVDYYGMTYSDFANYAQQNVDVLANMSEEEKAYYETVDDEIVQKLISTWDDASADLGEYLGAGDFTITKAQDTITLEQIANFADRDVCVTFVFTYNYETKQLEQTDVNADLVYTFGEKMAKAGMNTLMGMGTVFAVLILICLIIYCFRFIAVVQKKFEKQPEPAEVKEVVTQIEQKEQQQFTDDLELVAVITAAIAASTGTSADGFVVRSIRRR